jgi:hypothetical protein
VYDLIPDGDLVVMLEDNWNTNIALSYYIWYPMEFLEKFLLDVEVFLPLYLQEASLPVQQRGDPESL